MVNRKLQTNQSLTKLFKLNKRRRGPKLAIAACLIAVWSFVAWCAAKYLIVSQPLNRADAILILSGSATYRERASRAAALFKRGQAAKIILTNDNRQSSWSPQEQRNPYYWELAFRQLENDGVPAEQIEFLPAPVTSTIDEAVLLKSYAEKKPLQSILIVTSAYHSRRALWTFHRVFAGAGVTIGIDPVPPGVQTPQPAYWWLRLRGWETVPPEYVKIVLYWIRLQ